MKPELFFDNSLERELFADSIFIRSEGDISEPVKTNNSSMEGKMEIKSIWDGWEKQCYFLCSTDDGRQCAMDYIAFACGGIYKDAKRRIAAFVRSNYPKPERDEATPYWSGSSEFDNAMVVIYANNVLKLTPEDFRRIDRATQLEEALKRSETPDFHPQPEDVKA